MLVEGDERRGRTRPPLVDDPYRIGAVAQLGIDETSFLVVNCNHNSVYVTGLVDRGQGGHRHAGR